MSQPSCSLALLESTVEPNALWGGRCILFDNGPRLLVADNPAIENADRITVEAWVNTVSWPGRAVVCRKEGSYILYNCSAGFSWYLFGPDNRLQHDIAGTLGNGSWGYIVGTYDKDAGPANQRLYLNGTRVGGELQDGYGTVLLAEDTEAYELEILGPDDEVRRTVTGLTSPSFTYTTAMQALDFPEAYPASAFVVYQISAQVGRGLAGRFDFPDAPQLATLGENIAEGQAGGASGAFEAGTVMAQRYTAVGGRVLSASVYLGGGSGR